MPEDNKTNKQGVKGKVREVNPIGVLDLLFAGDIKTAFKVAVKEVLGPKLQEILVNFTDTVTRSFVYGDDYRTSYDTRSGSTNYRVISNSNNQNRISSSKPSDRYETIAYEFESYEDAKNTIAYIQNSIKQYKVFSVLNFYDYTGQATTPGDNRYGWTSIGDIRPESSRNGWIVRLPKPMEIDTDK